MEREDHCKHFLIWDSASESKRNVPCMGRRLHSRQGGSERFLQTARWKEKSNFILGREALILGKVESEDLITATLELISFLQALVQGFAAEGFCQQDQAGRAEDLTLVP